MVLDLRGQRFGRLLAIEPLGSAGKKRIWLFLCDCGASVEMAGTFAKQGHTTSCGCLRVDRVRESVAVDITGQRFGMLEVIGRAGRSDRGRILWSCRCDCGAEVERPSKNLRNGTAVSCGCRKLAALLEGVRAREVDLAGSRFGRLTILGEHSRPGRGVKRYLCECDCGGLRIARHGDLQSGKTISCGCAPKGPGVDPIMPLEARLSGRAHGQRRRARVKGAAGSFTRGQVAELFVKQRGRCACCSTRLGESFHCDHRHALALGGSNDILNIELLCPTCNTRKSAKDEIAWANENGRLL